MCADVLRVVLTEHDLVLGEVMMTELRRVLKTKLRLPEDRVETVEAVFSGIERIPKPRKPSPVPIADPTDRWILATAVEGIADVLVTGDEHLLSVADEAPLPILSPRAFWELLRRSRTP
jgi:predicted nucleic acid-binding protein